MSTTKQHFGKQVIGPRDRPYMVRYILFRWAHLPRVYVHRFCRSDDERAPHNHPWWFISLVLKGQYLEHSYDDEGVATAVVRKQFSFAYRPLSTWHRVQLANGPYGKIPCWTLVVTGPDVRGWGFRCFKREHAKWCRFPVLHCTCGAEWGSVRRKVFSYVVPWREFDGCGE